MFQHVVVIPFCCSSRLHSPQHRQRLNPRVLSLYSFKFPSPRSCRISIAVTEEVNCGQAWIKYSNDVMVVRITTNIFVCSLAVLRSFKINGRCYIPSGCCPFKEGDFDVLNKQHNIIYHITVNKPQRDKTGPAWADADLVRTHYYMFAGIISGIRPCHGILGSFYSHGLTLIPTWISNHIPRKVWNEITYPFPNFNGATVEFREWINNFISHFVMDLITSPCWIQR